MNDPEAEASPGLLRRSETGLTVTYGAQGPRGRGAQGPRGVSGLGSLRCLHTLSTRWQQRPRCHRAAEQLTDQEVVEQASTQQASTQQASTQQASTQMPISLLLRETSDEFSVFFRLQSH